MPNETLLSNTMAGIKTDSGFARFMRLFRCSLTRRDYPRTSGWGRRRDTHWQTVDECGAEATGTLTASIVPDRGR